MTPSYLRHKTFHSFLDAADRNEVDYPATANYEAAIEHFGKSALRVNGQGKTPLMRMAEKGWDELAAALVKRYPNAAYAMDREGRPVWYYLLENEPYPPDPNSIRSFQYFLKFPPMPNGDCPQHLLARNILSCASNPSSGFVVNQNKSALYIFINTPDDLLIPNSGGERPLDILEQCMGVFDSEEQELFEELINRDQNQRLRRTVEDNGILPVVRKM